MTKRASVLVPASTAFYGSVYGSAYSRALLPSPWPDCLTHAAFGKRKTKRNIINLLIFLLDLKTVNISKNQNNPLEIYYRRGIIY